LHPPVPAWLYCTAGATGAAAADAAADAGKAKASRNVKTPLQKEVLEASYQSKAGSAAELMQMYRKLRTAPTLVPAGIAMPAIFNGSSAGMCLQNTSQGVLTKHGLRSTAMLCKRQLLTTP
jgi:hypothetical protein